MQKSEKEDVQLHWQQQAVIMEEGFPKIFYDNIPAFSENYIIDVFM